MEEDADIYFEEFEKFNGLTIGMYRYSTTEEELDEYAAQNGFSYAGRYYDDENKMLADVEYGIIDAAVSGTLTYVDESVKMSLRSVSTSSILSVLQICSRL